MQNGLDIEQLNCTKIVEQLRDINLRVWNDEEIPKGFRSRMEYFGQQVLMMDLNNKVVALGQYDPQQKIEET